MTALLLTHQQRLLGKLTLSPSQGCKEVLHQPSPRQVIEEAKQRAKTFIPSSNDLLPQHSVGGDHMVG